jgi:putative endonuclease
VYILKSIEFDKFYTGKTDDIERRLAEHNSGRSMYSKRYRPWKVVYNEEFGTEAEATQRERFFKSASGRRWLKKNVAL